MSEFPERADALSGSGVVLLNYDLAVLNHNQ